MSESTKIPWCDATWNPWRGCSKVNPDCLNCYADAESARNPGILGTWGRNSPRVVGVESCWSAPLKWDAKAAKSGEPFRVFSLSYGDWLEQHDGPLHRAAKVPRGLGPRLGVNVLDGTWGEWAPDISDVDFRPLTLDDCRLRMLDVIRQTQHLTWQLLTKRPEAWQATMERLIALARGLDLANWLTYWINGLPPANVWVIASAGHQAALDAMAPALQKIPAVVRGISAEPLIGSLDFKDSLGGRCLVCGQIVPSHIERHEHDGGLHSYPVINGIDWVVVGGESGPNARPCDIGWIRSIVAHCRDAGVPVYVKQLGSNVMTRLDGESWPNHSSGLGPVQFEGDGFGNYHVKGLKHPKGGDPAEWPKDLRVREYPKQAKGGQP